MYNRCPDVTTHNTFKLRFNLIPDIYLKENLRRIADAENIIIDDETIDLIINRSSGHARNAQMLLDRYKLLGDVFKESVKSSKDDFAKLFLLCAQSNNWKKNVQENQEKIDGAKKMIADIIYKLQCNSLTALKTDYEDTVLDILKVSLGAKQSNIPELTTFAKYVGQSKENFLRIYRLLTYDSILKSFESDKMFQAAMWVLYLNI